MSKTRITETTRAVLRRKGIPGTVVVVLTDTRTGERRAFAATNIVTNDGDEYYAERGAGETPTNNFGGASGRMVVLDGTGAAPAKTSNFSNIGSAIGSGNPKAFDSGYPKSNDDDTDNANRAVDTVTYRTTYGTTEANGSIERVAVHLNGASGTDPLLMYASFGATIVKGASDTLKVFVNHNMSGV